MGNSKLKYLSYFFVLSMIVFSIPALEGSGRNTLSFENMTRLFQQFFPPDFSVIPDIFKSLVETIRIATMATLASLLISVLFALGLSNRLGSPLSRLIMKIIVPAIRTLPSLIWAVICVALLGPSPLAGVVALTLYSTAYLSRFFVETLDQSDPKAADWLRSQKAHPIQIFQYGIWPQIKASIQSQTLWMWEYNIRSASIIGYVGAGGLGLQLQIYQDFGQWQRFSAVLFVILAVVLGLEFIASRLRKKQFLLSYRS